MTVPVVAFFNNKGGVGKTTLVYHLAWISAELGRGVLAADLDPQSNLSVACLDEQRLDELWPEDAPHARTIHGAIAPLIDSEGALPDHPYTERLSERLHLLVGDLALGRFEDELTAEWNNCLNGKPRAFRVQAALWQTLQNAARDVGAEWVLVDLGPNLGAINRSALIAADFLVVPLTPDLFALQGLQNLGPQVRLWREQWGERRTRCPRPELALPTGRIEPVGYVLMQHGERLNRPVRAYERWAGRIPEVYAERVLGSTSASALDAGHRLGLVKHYRSLMPMAQEARKPMFALRPADGAIGAHAAAVQDARAAFRALAERLAERCGLGAVQP